MGPYSLRQVSVNNKSVDLQTGYLCRVAEWGTETEMGSLPPPWFYCPPLTFLLLIGQSTFNEGVHRTEYTRSKD